MKSLKFLENWFLQISNQFLFGQLQKQCNDIQHNEIQPDSIQRMGFFVTIRITDT
jgi:hypothetical protein